MLVRHHIREQDNVNNDADRHEGCPRVEVRPWLLLLDCWENPLDEGIVQKRVCHLFSIEF